MKIRNGFVSNSSSSSFIVTMKNGEKMTQELLMEIFDVKKTSPLYSFANDLSKWIIDNVKEMDINAIHKNYVGNYKKRVLTEDEMIEEIIEDYDGMDREELEKIANKEYRYYNGSAASDSGDGLEYYLCENEIDIETDIIKIKGGGGY